MSSITLNNTHWVAKDETNDKDSYLQNLVNTYILQLWVVLPKHESTFSNNKLHNFFSNYGQAWPTQLKLKQGAWKPRSTTDFQIESGEFLFWILYSETHMVGLTWWCGSYKIKNAMVILMFDLREKGGLNGKVVLKSLIPIQTSFQPDFNPSPLDPTLTLSLVWLLSKTRKMREKELNWVGAQFLHQLLAFNTKG